MKSSLKISLLVLFPILLMLASLALGSTGSLSPSALTMHIYNGIRNLFQEQTSPNMVETILWQVRLPRVLLTFLVGAALASSGGVLQAIFRNPIVDPFTLGISSGAAFGAALAMLIPVLSINLSAFFFWRLRCRTHLSGLLQQSTKLTGEYGFSWNDHFRRIYRSFNTLTILERSV